MRRIVTAPLSKQSFKLGRITGVIFRSAKRLTDPAEIANPQEIDADGCCPDNNVTFGSSPSPPARSPAEPASPQHPTAPCCAGEASFFRCTVCCRWCCVHCSSVHNKCGHQTCKRCTLECELCGAPICGHCALKHYKSCGGGVERANY